MAGEKLGFLCLSFPVCCFLFADCYLEQAKPWQTKGGKVALCYLRFLPSLGCLPLLAGLQRYNQSALIVLLWSGGFPAPQEGSHCTTLSLQAQEGRGCGTGCAVLRLCSISTSTHNVLRITPCKS